jgi:hypothetical protein
MLNGMPQALPETHTLSLALFNCGQGCSKANTENAGENLRRRYAG